MASSPGDLALAVGDGARRMTYAELAAVRGISALSAERLVRRKRWPRQTGNDGIVRVLVPLTEAREVSQNRRVASTGQPRASAPDIREVVREIIRETIAVSAPDDREDIRTLQRVLDERERTIAAHEETIRDLRARADRAERRIDELQTTLAEERRRLIMLLTGPDRVPWWRRWLR
jgi:hypothetical protein